jgi:hypothetical protein
MPAPRSRFSRSVSATSSAVWARARCVAAIWRAWRAKKSYRSCRAAISSPQRWARAYSATGSASSAKGSSVCAGNGAHELGVLARLFAAQTVIGMEHPQPESRLRGECHKHIEQHDGIYPAAHGAEHSAIGPDTKALQLQAHMLPQPGDMLCTSAHAQAHTGVLASGSG